MSICVCFVSERQITQSQIVIGQVLTEIKIYLSFNSELNNDHYDILLLVEQEEVLRIFDEIYFYRQIFRKYDL
jgi:hypothetical protein